MAPTFGQRIRHAWNTFVNGDPDGAPPPNIGVGYGTRPDRSRFRVANERSLIASIYTRISVDGASVPMYHARVNANGQFVSPMTSGLNRCLTLQANVDQEGRQFIQDAIMSLLEWGTIAIVPVDTTLDPNQTAGYDITNMRVGRITTWYPQHVQIELWNEQTGRKQQITLPKSTVAIVENPFYSVMNEPNSTLQRLNRKLGLLDVADDRVASGKLDMIIQLPYVVKSPARALQAQQRREDMEQQLQSSQYGIAYVDATEKITQLNRPADNTLQDEVTYLTAQLYAQLGLSSTVMDGSAPVPELNYYYYRTVEPILGAIAGAMKATFLSATAITQMQSIIYVRNPFTLLAITDIINMADAFARNEILTSNEIRGLIGFSPSSDPNADLLQNSNMPQPNAAPPVAGSPPQAALPAGQTAAPVDTSAQDDVVNNMFDSLQKNVTSILSKAGSKSAANS